MPYPAISIIIPHYRQELSLATCLSCLLQQDYAGSITIYVVDNSESYALSQFETQYPSVVFLWQPEAGSYNARNFALQQVKDELIAFTDTDCRPHSAWVRNGVECLLSDERIGIVGGRILVTPDNATAPSLSSFFEMATAFRQDDYVKRLNFVATANMFTRRSVFDAVGTFAGKQKSGGDYLWGRAVKAHGYRLAYAPDAVVEHTSRNYAQLHQKMMRLAAGRRDMNPGWKSAMLFILGSLVPPLRWSLVIIAYSNPLLPFWKKILLLVVCMYYRLLAGYYRLILAITNAPSPR